MDPEHWKEIERLCQSALEIEREKRETYLQEACAGDESLRKEVEALLAGQSKAEGFLKDPAIDVAAKALAKDQENAQARALIGRTISHYRIVEKLGQGGMGEVFLAEDASLHRKVALKFLPPEMQQDEVACKRLLREAHSAAALDHPYICSIHEVAQFEDKNFIVMEYVDGKTLRDKLRRRRLPLNQALQIATEVAEALQVAHGKEIIHRDLKPSNIMLTRTGHAKVMDFGLAKQVSPAGGVESREESVSTMTHAGVTLGTLAYMSPEQVRGEALDARSDIFSFGLVLYEMLTGLHPFQKESPMETASAILHEDPRPVGAIATGIPPDLDKLISRCLRKDLERRFQHIDDVKIILDEFQRDFDSAGFGEVPSTLKTQGTHRRKMVWVASAAAILIAVSFAAWRLLRTSRPDLLEQRIVPLTSYPGNEEDPSFSPDGTEVVFSWNKPGVGNPDIYRKLIGPGEPLRLTSDPARDISPAWSPDGRFIAFVRDSGGPKWEILMLPALGGPEQKLAEVTRPYEMDGPFIAWTPDGTALVIMDRDPPGAPSGLFLLSVDSRERRRLTSPPAGAHGDSSLSFSPDGRNLVFIRSTAVAVDDGLYVLAFSPGFSPQGETRRLNLDQSKFGCCPVWTPDGREIIFWSYQSGGGQLRRLSPFGNDPPRPLAIAGDVGRSLAISRQGNRLAYGVGMDDRDIWSLDISGTPGKARSPVKVISSSRDDILPRLSPDAKKIAFESNRSGNREIWVTASDGTDPMQLTSFGDCCSGTPRWASDSDRVVFDSASAGNPDIFVTSIGGGRPSRLTTDPAEDITPSWSHDGKWIYFCSNRTGERQVWKIPAVGGEAAQVTKKGGMVPLESTDGKYLYYSKGDSSTSIWRVPVTGGEEVQVVDSLGGWPNFDVVSDGIYYIPVRVSSREYKVQFQRFVDGKTQTVATFKEGAGGISVSPDRRTLIASRRENFGSDLMLVENFR